TVIRFLRNVRPSTQPLGKESKSHPVGAGAPGALRNTPLSQSTCGVVKSCCREPNLYNSAGLLPNPEERRTRLGLTRFEEPSFMYCNKCGHALPDGSRFCNYCGASMGDSPGPPMPATPERFDRARQYSPEPRPAYSAGPSSYPDEVGEKIIFTLRPTLIF